MMITVKVEWSNSGRPVVGSRVQLGFGSGVSEEIYTNENGEVDFEGIPFGRSGSIYVDGKEKFKGNLPARKVLGI